MHKMLVSAVLLLAVLAQQAPHTPPPPTLASQPVISPIAKAVISTWDGEEIPKFWPAGVPLSLTAARSSAGDLPQSVRWTIQPEWVDQWSRRTPDGRQISIATGVKSKTIKVTLYVAKNDTFDMAATVIAIRPDPNEPGDGERPTPGPLPTPTPTPTPTPVPPEPAPIPPAPVLSPMATQVRDLALRDIPDIATRKNKVWALAMSHEAVAGQISQAVAGVPAYATLKEPAGIIEVTTTYNRAAVGTDRPAFVPFFTALNEVLKPMSATTLSTAGGHIDVWKDIAVGLRAAAP